jgi:hypothetical protein
MKFNSSPSTDFNKDTLYAIKSIFLGARVHDAAALCNRSDQSMRDVFLLFCKKVNWLKFEIISVNAVNEGWNGPPVRMFKEHANHFLSTEDMTTDFIGDYLDDVGDAMRYVERSIGRLSIQLRIARARHTAMKQAVHLIAN